MIFSELTWVGPVLQASSRPWRVLAWDSPDLGGLPREFIVKHFRADQHTARVVEYVAARFAYETAIHAIPPELVAFTPGFLAELQILPNPARDAHLAEPGIQLAFEWNPRAVCLLGNHRALNSLDDPNQIGEIVGVDTVLVNMDRSDQNVLFEPVADYLGHPTHVLQPIDWEHSFAGGILDADLLRSTKLLTYSRPYTDRNTTIDPMCARIRSAEDFLQIVRKLGGWRGAKAKLRLLVQGVPPEWDVPKAVQDATVEYLVARVETTIRRLQCPDDPDNAFPNWQNSLGLDSIA